MNAEILKGEYVKGDEAVALLEDIKFKIRNFTRHDIGTDLEGWIQESIYKLSPCLRVETKWSLRKIDRRKYARFDWGF